MKTNFLEQFTEIHIKKENLSIYNENEQGIFLKYFNSLLFYHLIFSNFNLRKIRSERTTK